MSIADVLNEFRQTNVTPTVHKAPYNAISTTRTELSQAGRTILITGGATGAGFAMARAFVQASASTIVIVGRRIEVLQAARSKLTDLAQTLRIETTIIVRQCDISQEADINALWKYLADEKITVDVFVANAAAFSEPIAMMDLGTKKVWEMMKTNVKGPMEMAEKFVKQPDTEGKQKVSHLSFRNY
jgi:NAD(P)-dependent dehydrogenase (short-subunit alcohol dehydrogenase family)